jgi:hypothetical protein
MAFLFVIITTHNMMAGFAQYRALQTHHMPKIEKKSSLVAKSNASTLL